MKYLKMIILLVVGFIMFGCASIISKSNYPVNISSIPDNINFSIINKSGNKIYSGITPSIVNLKAGDGYFKKAKYTVLFNNPNYAPLETNLDAGFDGWYIGNIIFGGAIGLLIIDPLTGAMFSLDDLHVDLINSKICDSKIILNNTDELDIWDKDDDS